MKKANILTLIATVVLSSCSFLAQTATVPIVLSTQYVTVEVGKSVQILASAGSNGQRVLARSASGENNGLGPVTWQVTDQTVATIGFADTLCAVTGVSPGQVTIRAKSATGASADCLVQVVPSTSIDTRAIRMSQAIVPLTPKQQLSLNLMTADLSTPIVWAEIGNPSDAPVFRLVANDTSALVVGMNPGQATVRATQGERTATATVFVSDEGSGSSADTVYMTSAYPTVTVLQGVETPLSVTLMGIPANQTQGMQWTESKKYSSEPILRILANGSSALVTGLKPGVSAVEVTHPGIPQPYTMLISVNAQQQAQTLALSTAAAIMQVGGQVPIAATITNGQPSDYYNIVWKVEDTAVAKLLGSGQTVTLLGQSVGQTKLTATYMGLPVRSVDVLVQSATGATSYLSVRNAITLVKGRSEPVVAQVVGNVPGAAISALVWESQDPTIVSVFGAGTSGTIKALGLGVGKVKISHPGYPELTTLIQVQVVGDDSEMVSKSVVLNQSAGVISVGQQLTLTSMIEGGVTSDYQSVLWSVEQGGGSGGTSAVRLLGSGQTVTVLGLAPGDARVTASLGTHKAVCDVVVQAGSAGDNYIQTTNVVSLTIGQSQSVSALIYGNLPGAASSGMTWQIDNTSIATVFGSGTTGIIRGVSVGQATVTITQAAYNLKAQILVQVLGADAVAKPVSLVQSSAVMVAGQQMAIQAHLENGTTSDYLGLVWKVENLQTTAAVRVLGGGQNVTLLALAPGDAKVTVSSGSFSAVCDVLVQEGSATAGAYIQTTNAVSLGVGASQAVTAAVIGDLPGSAASKLVWTSENPSVATVFGAGTSGTIKGVVDGTTKIVITSPDYPQLTAAIQVQVLSSIESKPVRLSQTGGVIVVGQQLPITATIEGGTQSDYDQLIWDTVVVEGTNPVRLLGSGQGTTVLGQSAGSVKVTARLGKSMATCDLLVQSTSGGSNFIKTTNAVSMVDGSQRTVTAEVMGTLAGSGTSELVWSSANEAVVKVFGFGGQATLTASGVGMTQVTIKHPGSGLSGVIMVQVLATGSVTVSKPVQVSQSAAVMVTNQQLVLNATIENGQPEDYNALVWSVETIKGTSPVRVLGSGRTVTLLGLGEGEAKVTATVGTFTSVCQVIVQSGIAGDTYIQTTNAVSLVEAQVQNVSATIVGSVPGAALSGLVWVSSDPTVATVFGSGGSGTISGVKSGLTTIKISHPSYPTLSATIQVQVKSPVEITKPITISQSAGVMIVGQQFQLSTQVQGGTTIDYDAIQWSVATVSGTNPVRILGSGQGVTVLGLSAGEAKVTAKLGSASATCQVLVQSVSSGSTYIQTNNAVSLTVGQDETVLASIVGTVPGSALSGLTWTSANPSVAKVFGAGGMATITAMSAGNTVIEVAQNEYGLKAQIMVQVLTSAQVSKPVTLSQSSAVLLKDQQLALSADVQGGTSFDYNALVWSAEVVNGTTPARILGSGRTVTVLGLSEGEVKISAKLGSYTAYCQVLVQAGAAGSTYVDVKNAVSLAVSQEEVLTARVMGGASPSVVSGLVWTSLNPAIATVFGAGSGATIKGVSAGQTSVKITHPDYPSLTTVIQVQIQAAGQASKPVSLSQGSGVMILNQQLTLTASVTGGSELDYNSLVWSVTPVVGTNPVRILGSGRTVTVLGLAPGEARVAVSLGSFSAVCELLVQASEAGSSYIQTTNSLTLTTGQTQSVNAALVGVLDASAGSELTWESDNAQVAGVFGLGTRGTVTAAGPGTATLTVKSATYNVKAFILVRVIAPDQVSKAISINPTSAVVVMGQQLAISADIDSGLASDYQGIVWSVTTVSGTSPARVLGTGRTVTVLGLSQGEATVKATLGSFSATCQVLVQAGSVGSSYIQTLNAATLAVGGTQDVSASIVGSLPANAVTGLTWTSADPSVASVFGAGSSATITAEKVGKTSITVTHPTYGLTATIQVQVLASGTPTISKPVTLSQSSGILLVNQQLPLTATIENGGTTDYSAIVWSVTTVSGTTPARILGSGQSVTVIGLAEGEAKVKATLGSFSAECAVLVQPGAAGSLYVDVKNAVQLVAGQQEVVTAKVVGSVPASVASGLVWTSSNEAIASVFGAGTSGTIRAEATGTTTITVRHPSYPALSATINVQSLAPGQLSKPLSMSQSSGVIVMGQQLGLSVDIENGTANDYNGVVWSVTALTGVNPVRVLGSGRTVTVLGQGAGQVRVTAALGTYSVNCDLLVQTGNAGSSYIQTTNAVTLVKGQSQSVTANLVGVVDTSANSRLTWSTSSAAVAGVFGAGSLGTISANEVGTATVTVTSAESNLTAQIQVQVLAVGSVTVSKPVVMGQTAAVLIKDQQLPLTATIENGVTSDYGSLVWTITTVSGTNPVRILGSGRSVTVLGLAEGEATVKATLGSFSATCQVLVQAGSVGSSYIQTLNAATLAVGGTQDVSASIVGSLPANAVTGLTWTSADPSVASVFGAGASATITAEKVGKTSITVTHPTYGLTATIQVQVLASGTPTISKPVTLSQSSGILLVNQQLPLTATIENGGTTDYSAIVWSVTTVSGTTPARILGSGQSVTVIGLAEGEAKVKATLGSFSAECAVLVQLGGSGSVYIETTNAVSLGVTQSQGLNARIVGASSSASSGLVWTSANSAVAKVFGAGTGATLTGVAAGSTTLTITHPDYPSLKATVQVQVSLAGSISKTVTISQSSGVLVKDQQLPLTVNIEGGTTLDYGALVWTVTTVSGTTPARVLGSGQSVTVLGLSEGEAIIKATLGANSATCQILVQGGVAGETYLQTINLTTLVVGQVQDVSAQIIGSVPGSAASGLVWTSTDPTIASVFGSGVNGQITGLKAGETTIKISHPNYAVLVATILVKVQNPADISKPVTMSVGSSVVTVDQQLSLTATVSGGSASDYQSVVWSVVTVSGTSPVRVLGGGQTVTVLGLAAGEAKVRATLGSFSAECVILVQAGSTGSTYIQTVNAVTLSAGDSQELTARIQGGLSGSAGAGLVWTSANPAIAKIFGAGESATLTGMAIGTTTVTISQPTYGLSAIVQVQVLAAGSVSVSKPVTLAQTSAILVANQYQSLVATVGNGNASDYNSLVWSVTVTKGTNPVRILGTGQEVTLMGLAEGEATVTATLGTYKATCQVLVQAGVAGSSYIQTLNAATLTVGGTQDVSAAIIGSLPGNAVNALAWSSADSTIASVFGAGPGATITGLKAGKTSITVTHPTYGLTATIQVQVLASGTPTISKPVTLSQNSGILLVNQQLSLTAAIENGGATDYSAIVWSVTTVSGTTPARILGSGQSVTVIGLAEGEAKIKATLGSFSAECAVLVQLGGSGSVYIETTNAVSIGVTQSQPLTARIVGASAANASAGLVWTSTAPAVAKVFGAGTGATLTGVTAGSTTVTITHPDYPSLKATVQVQILASGAASKPVTLSQSSGVLAIDQQLSLSANIENGGTLDYQALVWSVTTVTGTNPARVLGSGQSVTVLGLSAGEVLVKATLGAFSATCQVLVQGTASGSVYIQTTNALMLTAGQSTAIDANLIGATDGSAPSAMTWASSNPAVASVFGAGTKGNITAGTVGTATITITSAAYNVKGYIQVQVLAADQVSKPVSFTQTSAILVKDQQVSLSALIQSGVTTDYSALVWTVTKISGTNPVRILGSGQSVTVMGLDVGEATVKATLGTYSATCQVLVQATSSGSSYIQVPGVLTMTKGQTLDVNAMLVGDLPASASQGLTWTSSAATMVSVFGGGATGKLTAVAAGTANITVAQPTYSLTATIRVQVSDPITTSKPISLNQSSAILVANQQVSVIAQIEGAVSTDYGAIVWSLVPVSGTNPVRVLGSGQSVTLLGMSAGEATVKATLGSYSATCQVLVQAGSAGSTYIQAPTAMSMTVGDVSPAVASVVGAVPESATSGLVWTSQDPTIAKVFGAGASGSITGVSAGIATIALSHPAYPGLSALIKVQVLAVGSVTVSKPISVSQSSAIMIPNQQLTLSAAITNGEVSDYNSIIWTVDSGTNASSYLRILGSGQSITVLGLAAGTSKVKARLGTFSAECEILVQATGSGSGAGGSLYITSQQSTTTVMAGTPTMMTAQLVGGSPIDQQGLVWTSSDPLVAKVFGGGASAQVTGLATGVCVVTVSHPLASTAYKIYVQVQATNQTLSLNDTGLTMQVGSQSTLVATLTNATEMDYSMLTWSVTGVAAGQQSPILILGSGRSVLVMATRAGGPVRVQARSSSGMVATCDILVSEVGSTAGTVPILRTSRYAYQFNAGIVEEMSVILENGNTTQEAQTTWSVDNKAVCSIIGSGTHVLLNTMAPGQATLTVSNPAASTPLKLYVSVAAPGQAVVLSQTAMSMVVGDQVSLTGTIAGATALQQASITWTSNNPSVVGVVPGGSNALLVAAGAGQATVTVTAPGCVTGVCNILVLPAGQTAQKYIAINPSVDTISVGEQRSYSAQIVGGTAADLQSLIWNLQSGTNATVIGQGGTVLINGVSPGISVVNIRSTKYPELQGSLTVAVEEVKYALTMSMGALTMSPSQQLTISAVGQNLTPEMMAAAKWSVSSNSPGLTITPSGLNAILTTNTGTGIAQVSCSVVAGGKTLTASLLVNVQAPVIPQVTKYFTTSNNLIQVNVAEQQALAITYNNATPDDMTHIKWTVMTDPDPANLNVVQLTAISTSGYVKGLKAGSATIVISDDRGGVNNLTMLVTVIPTTLSLSMTPTQASMKVGDTVNVTTSIPGAKAADYSKVVYAVGYVDAGVIRTASGNITANPAVEITGVSNNSVTLLARQITTNCYLIATLPGMDLASAALTRVNVESAYFVDIRDGIFNSNLYSSPTANIPVTSYPEAIPLTVASISNPKVATAAISDDGKGNRYLTLQAMDVGTTTVTVQSATGSRDTITMVVAVSTDLKWYGTPPKIGTVPGAAIAPGVPVDVSFHLGPRNAGIKPFGSDISNALVIGTPEMIPGSEALYSDGSADFTMRITPKTEGQWTVPIQNAMNSMTLNFEVRSTMSTADVRAALRTGTVVRAVGNGTAIQNPIVGADAEDLFSSALSAADRQTLLSFAADISGKNAAEPLGADRRLKVMRNTPVHIETTLPADTVTALKNPTMTMSFVSADATRTVADTPAGGMSSFLDYLVPQDQTSTERYLGYLNLKVKHGYNGIVEDSFAINVYGVSMPFGLDAGLSGSPPSKIAPQGTGRYTLVFWPKTMTGVTVRTNTGNLTASVDAGAVVGDQIVYNVTLNAGSTSTGNTVTTTLPAKVPASLGLSIPSKDVVVGYDAPRFYKKTGFDDQGTVQLQEGVETVVQTSAFAPGTTNQMFTFSLDAPAVVLVTGATSWTPVTGAGVLTSPSVVSSSTGSVTLNFEMGEGYYDARAFVEYPSAPGISYPILLRTPVFYSDASVKTNLQFLTNRTAGSGSIRNYNRIYGSADVSVHAGDGYDTFRTMISDPGRSGQVGTRVSGSQFEIPNMSVLTSSKLSQTSQYVTTVNGVMSVIGYHYLTVSSDKLYANPDRRKVTDTSVAGAGIGATLQSFYGTSDVDVYGEWTANPKNAGAGADFWMYQYQGGIQRYALQVPALMKDNVKAVKITRSRMASAHSSTSGELMTQSKPGTADLTVLTNYVTDVARSGQSLPTPTNIRQYNRPERGPVGGTSQWVTLLSHVLTGGVKSSTNWMTSGNDLTATTTIGSLGAALGSGTSYGSGAESVGFALSMPNDFYAPAFSDAIGFGYSYAGTKALQWQPGDVPAWIDAVNFSDVAATTFGYGGFIYITIERKVGPDVNILIRVVRKGIAADAVASGYPSWGTMYQDYWGNQRGGDNGWAYGSDARIYPDGQWYTVVQNFLVSGTITLYNGFVVNFASGWDSYNQDTSGSSSKYWGSGQTYRVMTPGWVYQF